MEEKTGKKVLIVGSSACTYTLAKKMLSHDKVSEVFVAPGNDGMKEFCTIVDIREGNARELLDFALENDINLTVAVSEDAIDNDIATVFQSNNQMIFAPSKESAQICLSKASGKKFMYKNRILCPKFGVFDKAQFAFDYLKKEKFPVVIKTDIHREHGILECNSLSLAKSFIDSLFENDEKKVVIDDYIQGHEFSFYVITDGYEAIPIGCSATYKHELDGEGGVLTSGVGAIAPDYKVSFDIENEIMRNIIYPTINALAEMQKPYSGILGVDLIMTDDGRLFTIKFNSFMQSPDCQSILELIDENIYNLFMACAIGSFADDYERIAVKDEYAVSCVLSSRKQGIVIEGLDKLEEETKIAHYNTTKNQYLEYETGCGRNLVLTRTARIPSKAVNDLYEEISCLKFDGMKFRTDIGKDKEI